MGGVDQLDSYLNNLRSCTGGKKWYWAQLINMVRVPQVTAYRFYCHYIQTKESHNLISSAISCINM